MKYLLSKIVPALLLASLMSSSAWAQGRIATVDLRKLFDNYWKTKQADTALKDRAAELEQNRKTMIDEWKKAKDEYQALQAEANNQNLSIEEREKRKKPAEDKLRQVKESEETIAQYERQAQTLLLEQKKRMRDNILEEIRGTVKGKATSAGYALVVDTAAEGASGAPVVLYANNENDLTDAVLSQLNAGAPIEPRKTEESATGKANEKKKEKK